MLQRFVCLVLICFLVLPTFAQGKILTAIKATSAPKIDGRLDDAVWRTAPGATDFIQNFPAFGMPATAKTSVRILYDNEAVYIGAYLYDDPSLIHNPLTNRDAEQRQDADYFSVFFDTYHDQQNGFQFLVTSANVQSDARLGANIQTTLANMAIKPGTLCGKAAPT